MFYVLRTNLSLAKLNIDPQSVKPEWRQMMMVGGMKTGHSPQEIALWIASNMPMDSRLDLNVATVREWIRKRKINPRDADMRKALTELWLTNLLEDVPHA